MSAERSPELVRRPDASALADAVAERLLARIAEAQQQRGRAAVVLTGGGIGTATLRSVAAAPGRETVDWSRVELWWGDERYLPAGDPDRNDTGADEALLRAVPLDPAKVHRVAGPERSESVEASAADYAEALGAAPARDGLPDLDVLLLGVGPDAHVASLFPEHPAQDADGLAVPVHDSPKPPPTRVSLSWRAIGAAREVWLLAAGGEKASAVAAALAPGAERRTTPASGAHGRERTVWFLDDAAAAELPG
ncbi:6-phosphogluconolactonase [Motilibacter peucedani]|uniref:6-phosphogluconolactonase n=1 Tax=Motilibacter peucedani TaxID=598650 RepID=A0A420XV97_9ACTN|nr:6-phosphogluconolactonase [Motilibacter peucedani]RKS84207.1 6-phosphogluconolactonase [Motilibacter peucedani]